MTTVLLILIYFIYIGLGIPDSVVGASWTTASSELGIAIGLESAVTSLTSLCTVTASFFSAKLINKFGTGKVTAFSTLLTAIALLGFSFSNSIWWFCLCAIPSGLGAGAIDAALNNFVSANYNSTLVNFLHCFYGIGVSLSPFIFSFALKNAGWRSGYRIVFGVQMIVTAIAFFALIFWKKITLKDEDNEILKPVTLTAKEMFSVPALKMSWLVFFSTCALEFTCNHWSAGFLEKSEGATASVAAQFLSLYLIGMTLGRFLSGVFSAKVPVRAIVTTGHIIIAVGIITQFLPVGYTVKGFALMTIGLGNGPTFPNLSYLSPKYFGKKYSQSVISSQMVMANLGITLMPTVFGVLAQTVSIKLFPVYIAVLYAVMIISTSLYYKKVDQGINIVENQSEI